VLYNRVLTTAPLPTIKFLIHFRILQTTDLARAGCLASWWRRST